jgi:glycosyltransferase involved in cell wall biosynthesis
MLLYPLLRSLRRRVKIVGYLYAREPLPLARMYDGIACLTDAAVANGRLKAPRAVVEKVGWGIECTAHHHAVAPYEPQHVLSVGVTGRDYAVIEGLRDLSMPVVICARGQEVLTPGGAIRVESDLLPERIAAVFREAAAVLVTLQRDDRQREAVGYTNVIEAMAFGRPIIKTVTGATEPEFNVESLGIGLSIPPDDPAALRDAVRRMIENPVESAAMGARARELCERHYNIEAYATRLHQLFERL